MTFVGVPEVHVVVANVDGPLDREPMARCDWDVRVPGMRTDDALAKLGGPSGTEPL